MASWYPQKDANGKLRLPYNRLVLETSRGKPATNRAEMDYNSYTMLGGDEGTQPSLVRYSDPKHTPASVRYNLTTTREMHYKVQLLAVNVKFLRNKSVLHSHGEEVTTIKERVARGTLDAKKQYNVTSATVSHKYRNVDYTLPRKFVSSAKTRYQ